MGVLRHTPAPHNLSLILKTHSWQLPCFPDMSLQSKSKLDWTNWKITRPASRAPVTNSRPSFLQVTDQGPLATCVAHSLAKGIFDYLQKEEGWYKDKGWLKSWYEKSHVDNVKDIIKTLEERYSPKEKGDKGIDPRRFNNINVPVHDGRNSMTLRMSIERAERTDKPFASYKQWTDFTDTIPTNFLIIGARASAIDPKQSDGGHALYVEDYDPRRRTFYCINSWGHDKDPKPRLLDSRGVSFAFRINLTRMLGMSAEISDQGDSSTCVCEALAKAVVEGLDDVGIDADQGQLTASLVNSHSAPPSQERLPVDYNEEGYRFQDNRRWYFLRIHVSWSTVTAFTEDALKNRGGPFGRKCKPKGAKYVLGSKGHALYAQAWDSALGKIECLNSWGKENKEQPLLSSGILELNSWGKGNKEQPLLSPDEVECIFRVDLIVWEGMNDGKGPATWDTRCPDLRAGCEDPVEPLRLSHFVDSFSGGFLGLRYSSKPELGGTIVRRKQRQVHFGEKPLGLGAKHWALQVGDMWYEIQGTGLKEKGSENIIEVFKGPKAKSGAEPVYLLGTTMKTDEQIEEFNDTYKKNHPTYSLIFDNCQTYVYDLFEFLMKDGEKSKELPWKQSPLGEKAATAKGNLEDASNAMVAFR